MQIQEYITSGILEAYVTGSLSKAEMREVEAMARTHPEVRRELDAIALAMEKYALLHARKPSPRVLEGLMEAVKAEAATGVYPVQTAEAAPRIRELRFRRLALAASILLFLSITANIYFYSTARRVTQQLADMREDNLRMAGEQEVLRANMEHLSGELAILQDPANVTLTLKGVPNHPEALANLCWNRSTGQVYVVSAKLPEPPSGKQYQLWALIGGTPVDAGVFDMDKGLQTMKAFPTADAFAVTLEPAGGSTAPTLEQMYVMAGV